MVIQVRFTSHLIYYPKLQHTIHNTEECPYVEKVLEASQQIVEAAQSIPGLPSGVKVRLELILRLTLPDFIS